MGSSRGVVGSECTAAGACIRAPHCGEIDHEEAGPEASALLHRLVVEEPDASTDPDDVVAILIGLAAERRIAAITADIRLHPRSVNLAWPKQRIEALRDPDHRVEAGRQLVAWLSGAGEEDG